MLQSFLNSHGGLVATVLMCVVVLNIILSAVSQVLQAMHMAVPAWFQPVTAFLLKVINLISANSAQPPAAK